MCAHDALVIADRDAQHVDLAFKPVTPAFLARIFEVAYGINEEVLLLARLGGPPGTVGAVAAAMATRLAAVGSRQLRACWATLRVVDIVAARERNTICVVLADGEWAAFPFAQLLLIHIADWPAAVSVKLAILFAWAGIFARLCDVHFDADRVASLPVKLAREAHARVLFFFGSQTFVLPARVLFVGAPRTAFSSVGYLVPEAVGAAAAFGQRARILFKFWTALHVACERMYLARPAFALARAQVVFVGTAVGFHLVERARLAVSLAGAFFAAGMFACFAALALKLAHLRRVKELAPANAVWLAHAGLAGTHVATTVRVVPKTEILTLAVRWRHRILHRVSVERDLAFVAASARALLWTLS